VTIWCSYTDLSEIPVLDNDREADLHAAIALHRWLTVGGDYNRDTVLIALFPALRQLAGPSPYNETMVDVPTVKEQRAVKNHRRKKRNCQTWEQHEKQLEKVERKYERQLRQNQQAWTNSLKEDAGRYWKKRWDWHGERMSEAVMAVLFDDSKDDPVYGPEKDDGLEVWRTNFPDAIRHRNIETRDEYPAKLRDLLPIIEPPVGYRLTKRGLERSASYIREEIYHLRGLAEKRIERYEKNKYRNIRFKPKHVKRERYDQAKEFGEQSGAYADVHWCNEKRISIAKLTPAEEAVANIMKYTFPRRWIREMVDVRRDRRVLLLKYYGRLSDEAIATRLNIESHDKVNRICKGYMREWEELFELREGQMGSWAA